MGLNVSEQWDLNGLTVSEVTEDSHAGKKKRRHQEISGAMAAQECHAKKRRLDFGRKSEKYSLQDDAVSCITMAESENDPPSSSSRSVEEIGGYAATCCSSNMGFSPEVQKSPISCESDAESCGSNSPEPEKEGGFDACDFAEQLLMFRDDEDDGDWGQYLSPDIDFLLEEEVSFDEEIGGYAATCYSSNMGFPPEVQKSPISYESDAESCGSNSPEPEQERDRFDAWDFAEQLLMFKDDEDDGDWEQYLSPDIDYVLAEVSFDELG